MKAALQLLISIPTHRSVVVASSSHPARCYWLRVYRPTAQWLTSKTVPNTKAKQKTSQGQKSRHCQLLVGNYLDRF